MQQVLSWKLLKLGLSHANIMFDQRNAFGSMKWGTLDKALTKLLKEEDMHFGEQRVYWASTLIETRDGEVELRPGQGAFMGDGLVVRFFAQHVQEPVASW